VSRAAAEQPGVAAFHLAAEVDEQTQEMTFLYRFLPGLCPASHGHHVARLAGLPSKVLDEARRRSAEFEQGDVMAQPATEPSLVQQVAAAVKAGDETVLRELFRKSRSAAA